MTRERDDLPRYLRRLLDGGWTPGPGEVVALDVRHDDDCAFWRGGACDCEPDIEMKRVEPTENRNDERGTK